MIAKDLISNTADSLVVTPAVLTGDGEGTGVDMKGYTDVAFYASVGASGDTLSASVYLELQVQVSDDNSTWAAAPDADIVGAVTGSATGTFAKIDAPAEDEVLHATRYLGTSRYVRVLVNLTGTHSNGIPVSVIALRGGSNYLPES